MAIALITGASSGLGKEFATIHAEHDGDLIIVARREEKLIELQQELASTHGIDCTVIAKDLTQPGAVQELYATIQEQGHHIDYLINNAGFGGYGKFHEREWQEDKHMIQLNILALTELTRLVLPDMIERQQGKILNVSSTASFTPGPLQAVYFATKSYVQFFSNAIARELKDSGVTVTNLMPGATATEFAQVADMETSPLFQQMVPARQVALDGYHAMLAGKIDCISGLTWNQKILMRLINFIPKKKRLAMIAKMQQIS